MLKICDDANLPRPIVNRPLERYTPDFRWPDLKLIVETDGYATHSTRHAFNHDRRRDVELLIQGWTTVRFSHDQVIHDPHTVAAQLKALTTKSQ
jgi:very-short-patch-repair endonuclease